MALFSRLTAAPVFFCLRGLPDGSWKAPGARLYWYEGLAFPVDR